MRAPLKVDYLARRLIKFCTKAVERIPTDQRLQRLPGTFLQSPANPVHKNFISDDHVIINASDKSLQPVDVGHRTLEE
jgi:hypothetical protein